jgi:hypothetical protein
MVRLAVLAAFTLILDRAASQDVTAPSSILSGGSSLPPDFDLGIEQGGEGDAAADAALETMTEVQENALQMVGAMVDSFLADEGLSTADKKCLVKGSQVFMGKILQVASHIVMLVQQLLGQRSSGEIPGLVDQPLNELDLLQGGEQPAEDPMAAAPQPTEPAQDAQAQQQLDMFFGQRRLQDWEDAGSLLMHTSVVIMELGYSLQLFVKLSDRITAECLNQKTKDALDLASKHAKDARYVGGRFLAHGADIVTELGDALLSYEEGKYDAFGSNVGGALRKIFLSNETASLPGGVKGKHMMVNMSMGFVKGFFGKGFTLGITLRDDPDEPMRIDLERCIANNQGFFSEIVAAAANSIAQHMDAAQGFGDQSPVDEQGKMEQEQEFSVTFIVAMMELPDALGRCGLGTRQADMLIDSIKAFGDGMHFSISSLNKIGSREEITEELGSTMSDWRNMDFYQLGFDIGYLMQNLVLYVFAQEYTIDQDGLLNKQLVGLGEGASEQRLSASTSYVLVACAVSLLLVAAGMTACRVQRRRGKVAAGGFMEFTDSVEAGSDSEFVE